MNGTYLRITAEDFLLCCPHCDEPLDEIQVHRLYELTVECPQCLQESQLCVTLSVA